MLVLEKKPLILATGLATINYICKPYEFVGTSFGDKTKAYRFSRSLAHVVKTLSDDNPPKRSKVILLYGWLLV
ncbi:uncharacterized protein EAE98_003357 [Botrytis deweyae]|uniref:Uncharacterized protein n=1 Tax=Botrytis deweyae TaxID=2478750 RepID=A0ABQ7ITB2_9HELO|nr:uncharacterized protein EAE98_003357 [Botrytis deweyae]KAF7920686.1 hypothetical protein EAE99_007980 [Botrytis elliptica]KAF7933648.1 hypothetical protein EAE98_003357 [Botrytis deweyae]